MSFGFDRFREYYKIKGVLVNLTSLSIGMGRGMMGATDNPVVKRGAVPYIPGSSLKGALRSEAERYARSTFGEESVCDILNPEGERGELKLKERANKQGNAYRPCVVCRVFGGPTLASHILVYDAFPLDGSYSLSVRRRVSINRLTGGQHPGRLFDVESVNPGCRWSLELALDNLDPFQDSEEARVLRHLFSLIHNEGLPVGGKRSIGLGVVKLVSAEVSRLTLEDGRVVSENVTERFMDLVKSWK